MAKRKNRNVAEEVPIMHRHSVAFVFEDKIIEGAHSMAVIKP